MDMHRPSEREFLSAVLEALDDLPEGFAERMTALLDQEVDDRSQAVQELIEDATRD